MKRISSGTVTVCVLAIVVGLVSAFVVKQFFAPKPQPVVEKPKEPTVSVVVAAKNLNEHQVIRRGDVRVIQIPAKRKPKVPALKNPVVAENRIIKQTLKAGQPITEEMLYGIGETLPGLVDRIPAGMRALPIHVDEQSVVAKMVNVGSKVDVALTVEGTHPDLGELATKTLLHSVEVIGVEKPSPSRRTAGPQTATITVAVTPADANRIINAEGFGTLDLTLCSPSNEVAVSVGDEDHKITKRDLLGLAEIPVPTPAKPFTIEKWEGGSLRILKISPEQVEEGERSTAASKKFNAEATTPVNAPVKEARTAPTAASTHAASFEHTTVPVTTTPQN